MDNYQLFRIGLMVEDEMEAAEGKRPDYKLTDDKDLLEAAKFALKIIAEFNAGGSIETAQQMKTAQQNLFNAVKKSDPKYYGFKDDYTDQRMRECENHGSGDKYR